MPPSPSSAKYRSAMIALRDGLRAHKVVGGYLEKAQEIRIGLHANDRSFKATGIYILPDQLRPNDEETHMLVNELRLRLVANVQSKSADESEDDPTTFVLTDLVGGIIDAVLEDREIAGVGNAIEYENELDRREVVFEVVETKSSGFWYRAEVPIVVHLETPV